MVRRAHHKMEFINNIKRGYKHVVKWASSPNDQKNMLLVAILALSITLAYGMGYLTAYNSNPAPIIIQTNS